MADDKDAAMRAATAPEQKPATVRLLAHSGGKVYEVEATPRPGMSRFTGAMMGAMDQLGRQGIHAGFFTLADYDNWKEEPCKS